jgi:hypothetical protein
MFSLTYRPIVNRYHAPCSVLPTDGLTIAEVTHKLVASQDSGSVFDMHSSLLLNSTCWLMYYDNIV